MGIKRYELDELQWVRIARLLPGKACDPGRTGLDNRLFGNACLWVLRSGALARLARALRQVEDGAPALQPVCHAGVWERVFDTLAADRDNRYLMLDSTIVRAHQQAPTRARATAFGWSSPFSASSTSSVIAT